jgi:hypothetical protein
MKIWQTSHVKPSGLMFISGAKFPSCYRIVQIFYFFLKVDLIIYMLIDYPLYLNFQGYLYKVMYKIALLSDNLLSIKCYALFYVLYVFYLCNFSFCCFWSSDHINSCFFLKNQLAFHNVIFNEHLLFIQMGFIMILPHIHIICVH